MSNHKQNDCPKRRQDNAKHVVYVKGESKKFENVLLHNNCVVECESNTMDNIDHMYPVSFNDINKKVNVTIQGCRNTGANICVLKEGVIPRMFSVIKQNDRTKRFLCWCEYSTHVSC